MSLLTDLVSYWKLDEASGDALDAHGANDLTDNNTVGSGTGKINNGRDFEFDNSEYFSHSDNADLSTGDIDFTFALWIKLEGMTGSFQSPINKGGVAGAEFFLQSRPEWRWSVCPGDGFGGSFVTSSSGNPSDGTWYFVVVWHDSVSNEIGIQVNDGTPDTTSYSGGSWNSGHAFRIGSYPDYSQHVDGVIDEVGFWKRVLTSQERTDLYNSGNGLAYPFSSYPHWSTKRRGPLEMKSNNVLMRM